MKRLSFIFLFFFIAIEVDAQQHEIPFPDSNAVWRTQTYIPPDPADPFQLSTMCSSQFFSHDTSHVNGIIYNNLYLDYSQSDFFFMYEDISIYTQIGRFRVDGQKVYYQNLWPQAFSILNDCYIGYHGGNQEFDEFLMYDFGLAIGDTFHLTPFNFRILESIDSTLIEGAYYRKFNFSGNDQYHWIEGIGSSIGFFPYFDFFEKTLHFNCFIEDEHNFVYYPNGMSCSYLEIGVEENQLEFSKTLIKIVDVMGRETEDQANTLFFFMYDDGTSEKVFRTE